jgi:hypothetical protein
VISSQTGGIALVILGCAVNKWTLEATVIPDGFIETASTLWAIGIVQLALIAAGAWLFIKAPHFTAPTAGEWILLMTSTVMALGLGEILLRLVGSSVQPNPPAYVGQYQNRPSRNFVADSHTGWRMRENHEFQWTIDGHINTYRSNRQGFRSGGDFDTSPEVIVGLAGDSFAWGTGVEYNETFGALLEARLAGGAVYNFAMPGFGIDQMWMSVRHQMLPLSPDLVVVAFIDEDFNRSLTAYRRGEGFNKPRFLLDSGHLRLQTPEDVPNRLLSMLQTHSELWKAVTSYLRQFPRFKENWTLNTAILEAIAAECKLRGVPVLFVRLPGNSFREFNALADWMGGKGFEFIDLGTPVIPSDIHFKNDRHINAKGHRFVADSMIQWLHTRLPRMLGPASKSQESN